MPRLGQRLRSVANQIHWDTHADIGSDHAGLLAALLRSGKIRRGIAIENKRQPYENSRHTLAGLKADVRFGDGLSMLGDDEADSLSVCGLGGESIVQILRQFPNRVPDRIVLQPNLRSDIVRRWALEHGFALVDERHTEGRRVFEILALQRSGRKPDPAYADLEMEAALTFGPILLKRRDPALLARLREESAYLRNFCRLSADSERRLSLIERCLEWWNKNKVTT